VLHRGLPENIKITDNACPDEGARRRAKHDPLTWLGSKIGRRPHHDTPAVPAGKES
jgi:hypothetical protein